MSDHDSTYWSKLSALLASTSPEQPMFVDAGAHCGDFTALLLKQFPACTVFAVEPNTYLWDDLTLRFSGQNVRICTVALDEGEGQVDLRVHANSSTSSVLPRPKRARRYYASSDQIIDTVAVRAVSLDHLAADAGIDRINLLKLDTQGAELAIIRGAQHLLQRAAIDVIYTEFFLVSHYEGAAPLHELAAALSVHGYLIYDLFKGPYGRNGQLRFGDAIFVSPSVREQYLDRFPDEA